MPLPEQADRVTTASTALTRKVVRNLDSMRSGSARLVPASARRHVRPERAAGHTPRSEPTGRRRAALGTTARMWQGLVLWRGHVRPEQTVDD